MCDYAAPAGIIDGRLVALHGADATFQVDRVKRPSYTSHDTPTPVAGQRLVVTYESGDQRYLRTGQRYKVMVWWLHVPSPPRYFSSVHTPKRECSGGTIYADGTTIDT